MIGYAAATMYASATMIRQPIGGQMNAIIKPAINIVKYIFSILPLKATAACPLFEESRRLLLYFIYTIAQNPSVNRSASVITHLMMVTQMFM